MDTPEEASDYDSMDHREVNELFVDDLLAAISEPGDVLDVGTGTAQIPVALCSKHETCRVMAAEAAANMLDLAKYNIEAAGLTQRIELTQIDAKEMPLEDEMFDTVMSNSIIHHIPQPIDCLRESVRVCKTGGTLFFRDLVRLDSNEKIAELVELYAGNENEHQKKMFDDSLRAALTLDEIRELVRSLGFAQETVEQTSDRHWTWIGKKT